MNKSVKQLTRKIAYLESKHPRTLKIAAAIEKLKDKREIERRHQSVTKSTKHVLGKFK